MSGQGVLTAAEYYSGSMKHLSDIAEATMGTLKGIEFWKGTIYRMANDPNYAEGVRQKKEDATVTELRKQISEMPVRTEEAPWYRKFTSAIMSLLEQGGSTEDLLGDSHRAWRESQNTMRRLGLMTQPTETVIGNMKAGLVETFGKAIGPEDIGTASKGVRVKNDYGGEDLVPVSIFLGIIDKLKPPLDQATTEGLNKLREWEKQGFKVPAPTKEKETEETKPGAKPGAMAPRESNVNIGRLSVNVNGKNIVDSDDVQNIVTETIYQREFQNSEFPGSGATNR